MTTTQTKISKPTPTPEQATQMARDIFTRHGGDWETTHYEHDELMARILADLGYGEMVDVMFNEGLRWYA